MCTRQDQQVVEYHEGVSSFVPLRSWYALGKYLNKIGKNILKPPLLIRSFMANYASNVQNLKMFYPFCVNTGVWQLLQITYGDFYLQGCKQKNKFCHT